MMSSTSVKRRNSRIHFTSKHQSQSQHDIHSDKPQKSEKMSFKSRLFKLLFHQKGDDMDKTNKDNEKTENKQSLRDWQTQNNQAIHNNHINDDHGNDYNDYNDNIEGISYKDIKSRFDEIDRSFGTNSVYLDKEKNMNNHKLTTSDLTNCEIESPIKDTKETNENGEGDENDKVPYIWEQNQYTTPSYSFCVRFEDKSNLKNESNFVLINNADYKYCSNYRYYANVNDVNDVNANDDDNNVLFSAFSNNYNNHYNDYNDNDTDDATDYFDEYSDDGEYEFID